LPEIYANSGSTLDEADGWCVAQVHLRARHEMPTTLQAIGHAVRVPGAVLLPAFRAAAAHGYLTAGTDGWSVTPAAATEFGKFSSAFRAWLGPRLPAPGADDADALSAALSRLTGRLLEEETAASLDNRLLAVAGPRNGPPPI
jgi:hypothetical protein